MTTVGYEGVIVLTGSLLFCGFTDIKSLFKWLPYLATVNITKLQIVNSNVFQKPHYVKSVGKGK